MTNKNQPTCAYCQELFAAGRAELGYDYCMKKACCERGFKVKPTEIIWTEADTARF